MLQAARAQESSPLQTAGGDATCESPHDAWPVLSPETALGFDKACLLRDALESLEDRGNLNFLFRMGSDSRPASLRIVGTDAAIEQLAALRSALAIVCSA